MKSVTVQPLKGLIFGELIFAELIFVNLPFSKNFVELIFVNLRPKNMPKLIPRVFNSVKINTFKVVPHLFLLSLNLLKYS